MSQEKPFGIPQSYLEPVDDGLLGHPDQFIQIENLEDFRAQLRDDHSIRFFRDGPFVICRYTVAIPDVFQTAADLESRGLIFDAETGALLSRPLHKFFNLGERDGLTALDQGGSWRLEEKRDGSMIGAFVHNGEVLFHTRGGLSDHAKAARAIASSGVVALVEAAFHAGLTPIFEWTAPENRIVIPYARSELTLLTLRDRLTGHYEDDVSRQMATAFNVPHVEPLGTDVVSANDLIALLPELSARTDIEGAVLVGPNGRRLKVKTLDYLRRHKILANLGNERYAYEAWVDDVIDDTAAALGGGRARALLDFAAAIEGRLLELEGEIHEAMRDIDASNRKVAAAQVRQTIHGSRQALVFAALDGTPVRDTARRLLSLRVPRPEKREAIKAEFGLPSWKPIELISD